MVALVESDFVVGGSPALIREGSSRWLAFSDSADAAADGVRGVSDGSGEFIGPEGELYRERLNSDLIPQLRTVYQAWLAVGSALSIFASDLEGFQTRMSSLRAHAESASSVLTSARGAAADAVAADSRHAADRDRQAAMLSPGAAPPPDSYRSGALTANARVQAAEGELQDCVNAAAGLRGAHAAAVERCRAAIAAARELRFAEPPGWLESALGSVVDWVADHADVLRAIADVLDNVSTIAAMLAFIPGVAGVATLAGAASFGLRTVADFATGEVTLGSFFLGAAALLPGGKAAKGAIGGVGDAVAVTSRAGDAAATALVAGEAPVVAGVVRTGNELGGAADEFAQTARFTDDVPSPNDAHRTSTPAEAQPGCGDPVDVVTGAVFFDQQDLALPGTLPLVLRRVHISTFRHGRLFGRSWASTLDQRVVRTDGGAAYVGEAGSVLHYPGGWEATVGARQMPILGAQRWSLTRTVAGGFEVFDPLDRVTRVFADPGKSDEARIERIVDASGNSIEFDYGADGTLRALEHSGGYLVRIVTTDRRVRSIRLVESSGDETEVQAFEYDARGLVTEVRNSSGLSLRYAYDDDARLAGWIDRNGLWFRYTYDDSGRCIRNGGRENALKYRYSYSSGRTEVIDSCGGVQVFEYSGSSRQVGRHTDQLGGVTVSEWDRFDWLLCRTDARGQLTRWFYDDSGAVTRVIFPDGAELRVDRDERSLPVQVVEPDGLLWANEFDDLGRLSAAVDPMGERVTFTNDSVGALTEICDSRGTTTTVERNEAGLPVAVVDPMGRITRIERDAFGRVVRRVDPTGAVTSTAWSVDGKPLARTGPDGAVDSWTWDGEGNLLTHTNPVGALTRFAHAVWDLPVARVDPDGARYEFTYDTELRMTTVTNPLGFKWIYEYDLAGRLIGETDFNGRRLRYERDAVGRLIGVINAAGQRTTFEYDAAGNQVSKYGADGVTTFVYDLAGRIVAAESPGVSLQFERDPLGRILAEVCNGRRVVSAYDSGRRTRRTLPSGVVTEWDYDPAGRAMSLNSAGHAVGFGYDAAGREISRSFAAGARFTFTRDEAGRVVDDTLTSVSSGFAERATRLVSSRSYQYQGDGGLTAVLDRVDGATRSMDLDPMGRMISLSGGSRRGPDPHTWSERYAYDATGSVVDAQHAGVEPGVRQYTGSRVTRVGNTTYGWDRDGRMTSRSRTRLSRRPEVTRFVYDSADRLMEAVVPDGTRWTYVYDPLGRRVSKHHHDATGAVVEQSFFVWDGPLLAEELWTARAEVRATSWEYQQDGFRPIGQHTWVAGAEDKSWIDRQFHAIVSDLVGTPTDLVTPDGQDIRWTAEPTTIWGAPTTPPTRSAVHCPLRFPGQYHDDETGLNYNRHRYYEPQSNRYTTVDPLGLAPAPDAHAYVVNPLTRVDPLGLAPCSPEGQQSHQHALLDSNILVRGGTNVPDRFTHGSGVIIGANGTLNGVSVTAGKTIEEASRAIRNGQIGVATVDAARRAGAIVVQAPTPNNVNHVLLGGLTAEQLSSLFTPTIKNPWSR